MQTRKRHALNDTTVSALSQRKNGQSLRSLARALGYDQSACAMLSDVLRKRPGALTPASESDLRQRLGLSPVVMVQVAPCPSCGDPHGKDLDCHGKPVAAVVILGPNDVVRRVGRKRNRNTKGVSVQATTHARLSHAREQVGMTWDKFLNHLLDKEDQDAI